MKNRAKGLSVLKIARIGFGAIKRHFVRFFFVTLLFSLTLSFFIFSFSTLFYDAAGDYVAFYRAENREYASIRAGIPADLEGLNPQTYFKNANNLLKKRFPEYEFETIYRQSLSVGMSPKIMRSQFPLISGTVTLTANTDALRNNGFRLLEGRLPESAEECCISELHYLLMKQRGYQPDADSKIIYPVRSFRDLTMREVIAGSGVVITGVVGTPFDVERYIDVILNAETDRTDWNDRDKVMDKESAAALRAELTVSAAAPVFVSEDYLKKNELAEQGLYFKLSGDDRRDKQLLKNAIPKISGETVKSDYQLSDPYFEIIGKNLESSKNATDFGLIIMAIFGVFTILMMFNFIGVAIKIEQRQIGIYRSLGMGNGKIFEIFFTESLLSALIAFAAASGITYLLSLLYRTLFMPKNLFITFAGNLFLPEWYVFLVGAAFAVAVAFIGTLIPFAAMFKKKPAEIIRKGNL